MNPKPHALIIGLLDTSVDLTPQQASLKEAELLLETYGAKVDHVLTQNASHLNPSTVIGTGKVEEIKQLITDHNLDLVVINHHLKAGQLYTLIQSLCPDGECEVWDRTGLILQIFEKHAHTAEAKLQIELAQLEHKGPELSGMGHELSQQAGGIGTRGLGETGTEIMQRHWKEATRTVREKLKKVEATRQQQMKQRKDSQLPTVSIIGYTNAGKTSLFNLLSGKQNQVENALFATLDSSVGDFYLPTLGRQIFLSDTIGFIQDLPTLLIQAFKSTLMETVNADLLLHVIDSADPNLELKISTVETILEELSLNQVNQLYVFNKQDLISQGRLQELTNQYKDNHPIFISAQKEQGIELLISHIQQALKAQGLTRAPHLAYLDHLDS